MRIGAGSIDSDDVGLVFNGACFEQGDPVFDARGGPVSENDEEFGNGSGEAEDFWEAEVVADEGGEGPIAEGHRFDPGAAGARVFFAGGGEGVDFGVVAYDLTGGIDEDGVVGEEAIAVKHHASKDSGLILAREIREKVDGRGLVGNLGDFGKIHAEPSGKHFWENDERIGFNQLIGQQG